jgi:hypothetical protein
MRVYLNAEWKLPCHLFDEEWCGNANRYGAKRIIDEMTPACCRGKTGADGESDNKRDEERHSARFAMGTPRPSTDTPDCACELESLNRKASNHAPEERPPDGHRRRVTALPQDRHLAWSVTL